MYVQVVPDFVQFTTRRSTAKTEEILVNKKKIKKGAMERRLEMFTTHNNRSLIPDLKIRYSQNTLLTLSPVIPFFFLNHDGIISWKR